MAECPFRRIVNLRRNTKSETYLSAAKSLLGANLLTTPNSAAAGRDANLLWLGSNE